MPKEHPTLPPKNESMSNVFQTIEEQEVAELRAEEERTGCLHWRHLFYKFSKENSSIYMIIVLLAFLATKETIELTNDGLTAPFKHNFYCSNEKQWYKAEKNRTFVFAEESIYEVRDSTLNGICADATIDFLKSVKQFDKELSDACDYTAYDVDCDWDEAATGISLQQMVLNEWIVARRSGLKAETISCSVSNTVCNIYFENQAICIDSAVSRATMSKAIGVLGLLIYPLVFWRHTFNFISYLIPLCWSLAMLTYKVDTKTCLFYAFYDIALFVLIFCLVMLFINLLLFILTIRASGMTVNKLERYLKNKLNG